MLLDIIQITLPALLLFITTLVLVRGFLKNQSQSMSAFLLREAEYRKADAERRSLEISKANKEITMPLRLHAYERMTLFCTRLELTNMIKNSKAIKTNLKFLTIDLIFNIEDEFNHNISQQMYMTDELWKIIQLAKMETISIIQNISKETEAAATDNKAQISDFINSMDQYLSANPQLGYIQALSAIKKEVSLLY
jgi:hypothetical protein